MRYRTITDLPTELLHTIFSQVQNFRNSIDRYPLYSSSLTCKRLRDVSLEFVFHDTLTVRDITTFEHLLRFLETNPRALKRIQSLTLSGTSKYRYNDIYPIGERYVLDLETAVDEALVARIVDRLPSLQIVSLESFLYLPPTSQYRRNDARRPCELRSLSIRGTWTSHCSIAGMFQVLSLFSAHEMDVDMLCYSSEWDDSRPFDVRSFPVHQSLTPALLYINAYVHSGPTWTTPLLDALTLSLRPGALRDLCVIIDNDTAALGELLLRAGGSITALSLHRHAESSQSERDGWIDPLENTWQKLNIAACTSLESIYIPIYFGPSKPKFAPQEALALPIAHILQHTSPTLRKVVIELRDLYRPTTIANEKLLKLHELDKVLVEDRFPKLEQFWLDVCVDRDLYKKRDYWPKCVDAARRILPNLHARGRLFVRDIAPSEYES